MRSRAWLITDDDSQKENSEELYEDALVHHQWLVQRRDFESSAVTLRLDASALVQGCAPTREPKCSLTAARLCTQPPRTFTFLHRS
ncbi:hypothetical protein HYQ46_009181 [Verticillium longisporum]|nr:hypothetical protein HYQ46_009181 [Verticillium longisporum]